MDETSICTDSGLAANFFSRVDTHHGGYHEPKKLQQSKNFTAVVAISAFGRTAQSLFIVGGKMFNVKLVRATLQSRNAHKPALKFLRSADCMPSDALVLSLENGSNEKSIISSSFSTSIVSFDASHQSNLRIV